MHQIIAKTRQDYNRIASLYAKTRNAARELEQFADFVQKGQKVLDWGCGNGRLVHLLKNKDVEYYGIDQSSEMIRVAKEEFAREVQEGWVHFECNEEGKLNFSENFFDLVFAIASVHHLPDPDTRLNFFKDIFLKLKKGGLFIMTNWNLESAWAQEKFKKDWQKIGENDYLIPWKNQEGEILVERYYHHFNFHELQELLEKVGFSIEKWYYARGVEKVVPEEGKNLVVIAKK